MPTPRSLGEVIVDVESLLAAMELNAEQLPNLDADKAELQALLTELKQLASQRENFKADKLVVTQKLKVSRQRAQDALSNLRAQLKGKLGTRNQKLQEFGVAPNKGAGGRKKKVPVAAPEGVVGIQAVQAAGALPGTPVALVVVPSPAFAPSPGPDKTQS